MLQTVLRVTFLQNTSTFDHVCLHQYFTIGAKWKVLLSSSHRCIDAYWWIFASCTIRRRKVNHASMTIYTIWRIFLYLQHRVHWCKMVGSTTNVLYWWIIERSEMLAAPCLFVWTLPTHQLQRAEYKNVFIQDGQIKRQKNFEHKRSESTT